MQRTALPLSLLRSALCLALGRVVLRSPTGLFQRYFVERYKWMSLQVFTELFSLGQCLPGPTSTQVSFAMGTVKKGVLGASVGDSRAARRYRTGWRLGGGLATRNDGEGDFKGFHRLQRCRELFC